MQKSKMAMLPLFCVVLLTGCAEKVARNHVTSNSDSTISYPEYPVGQYMQSDVSMLLIESDAAYRDCAAKLEKLSNMCEVVKK